MTTEDVYLLHAIKNHVPTNWVEVLKDNMTEAALSQSHYLPYAVLVIRILILQGVNVDGEQKCSCNCTNVVNRNTVASLGTNFLPETIFERFVADQFKNLNERVTNLERKLDNAQH
ncbi:hypothetical protein LR48_Vigan583s001200 [Vigna angularis]|uniref:Uncharacterized protein n=1 Tax=Phaseolus angularis TaxID=3914 RepID=A0A0L9TEF4_PHAAN|nr:hypothetical protein LR48_Vigan583s001200 [Vigna angularis]